MNGVKVYGNNFERSLFEDVFNNLKTKFSKNDKYKNKNKK
jgi:hypothetical protein